MKKTITKKPMIKSGRAKSSIRKYQEGAATSSDSEKRTFADYYKANLAAGLKEKKAKQIAMVEAGVKEPKRRLDPNAVINAVGNTAGAVGNVINAVRPRNNSSNTSGPGDFKKGGTMKKVTTKKYQTGGTKKTTSKPSKKVVDNKAKPRLIEAMPKRPLLAKKGGAVKSKLVKAQTGKSVKQMTDAEKKSYSDKVMKSQNKEYIQAGEKGYFANKDGRVSIVDYAGKNKPFYTKTIDTTGLSKGVKSFKLERDIDRGKGYDSTYTPITKTATLKAINNWKNQTNREKVAANKKKVAANAAKYKKSKLGGALKSKRK